LCAAKIFKAVNRTKNRGFRGYARINTTRVNSHIRAYPRNPRSFVFFIAWLRLTAALGVSWFSQNFLAVAFGFTAKRAAISLV